MQITLEKLVGVLGGKLITQGNAPANSLQGVSTDSRQVKAGSVFVALRGENFDAHDFLDTVVASNAGAIVVSRDPGLANANVILVSDTLDALNALAAWWRLEHKQVPVSVVVGSSGKTTTKEMAGEIVQRFKKTLTTRGNFNNLVGLPITMFELQQSHEAAVLELGMNCPDENRKLMAIAQPDCVLLTNINHAHIGMFESVRAHYEAEAEPLQYAAQDALIIINADDPMSLQAYSEFGANRKRQTFSVSSEADFCAKNVKAIYPYGYEFTLCNAEGQEAEVTLKMFGRHNVANAVAAAAIAAFHGVSLGDAAEQLSMFQPRYNRSEIEVLNGIFVIKDYYNAIPAAVISALESLRDMEISGSKYAVLGDMRELGTHEHEFHEKVAEAAAQADLDELFTVGEKGRIIDAKARELGVISRHFDSLENLAAELRYLVKSGDIVLIKGSRALKLEHLYELLKNPVAVH